MSERLVSPDGAIDWNRYYSSKETNQILGEWARRHQELTELYPIGTSYAGADLMMLEITNEATGRAAEKPALYIDGAIHGNEPVSSAAALYLAGELLAGYGKDTRITNLLDTAAFYIRPIYNPDGLDLALLADQPVRSSLRPWDEDSDGSADEDPPEDLDADGWITLMRVRSARGLWEPGEDPRSLLPRKSNLRDGRYYTVYPEGIDNDRDGRYNEDGIGGMDIYYNFPHGEKPHPHNSKAGPYPLSEPETRATVEFIMNHPNIVGIIHGHSPGGYLLLLPESLAKDTFHAADMALIKELALPYIETTGRQTLSHSTNPMEGRFGSLISWAYAERGIPGWVLEYSPAETGHFGWGPKTSPAETWITDYNADGRITEIEALRFNDKELGGRYFSPWRSYQHPQLGEVEIGGWHKRFWGQNPPAEFLEAECRRHVPWILSLLEKSPRIEIDRLDLTPLPENRYRLTLTVKNTGWMPTHLTEYGFSGVKDKNGRMIDRRVKPPSASLELEGGEILGEATQIIGHLNGSNTISKAVRERSRSVNWTVSKTAPEMRVHIVVDGATGGAADIRRVIP